jgi:hypothetical protein
VARPRIWQPFEKVKWASSHEFTDAGDIRDRHRNVLPVGDGDVSLRLYDTARKVTFPRREILALEYFGEPPEYRCCICDKRLSYAVVHLNGNRGDFSRDNLKRLPAFEARWHKFKCIRWAMESNLVPPREQTKGSDDHPLRRVGVNSMPKKSRSEAPSADDDDDDREYRFTPFEFIPLLGINPERKTK